MKLKKPKKTKTIDQKKSVDLDAAADFISEAEARGTDKQTVFPWEGEDSKKSKAFNLRLPLDLYAKLKYVSDNTPRTSMNNICLDGLEPYIEQLLQDILKKKKM